MARQIEKEIVITGRNETRAMFSEIARDSQAARTATGAFGGALRITGDDAEHLASALGDADTSAGAFARGLGAARREAEDTADALNETASAAE